MIHQSARRLDSIHQSARRLKSIHQMVRALQRTLERTHICTYCRPVSHFWRKNSTQYHAEWNSAWYCVGRLDHGKPQLGWTQADRSSDSVKEACHLKDRNNSGGLCWLIENLVDFSWRPTSKIVFQMASLFHRIAAGSIEYVSIPAEASVVTPTFQAFSFLTQIDQSDTIPHSACRPHF